MEEGKAYWEMNRMLVLLHASSTILKICQCKSRCDGAKLTRWALYLLLGFAVNYSYLVCWAQLIFVSVTVRIACTKRLGAN